MPDPTFKIDGATVLSKSGTTVSIDSSVTNNAGVASGTIADGVAFSNKYYLQLTSPGWGSITSGDMVNNSGTAQPYFTPDVGDLTNIVAVNAHDYKIVQAGVYLVSHTAMFYQSGSGSNRFLYAKIRTNRTSQTSSEGTDVIAQAAAQVSNTTSSDADYASATCMCVFNFSANALINFQITGHGTVYYNGGTASIVLIRPL